EHGRTAPVHAQVGAGGEPEAALKGAAEVSQNVGEEVGGDHDVDCVRPQHHAGCHRVHMDPLQLHVGVRAGDLRYNLVPQHVRVTAGVRLGHADEPAAALTGSLKGEASAALDGAAGENRHLDGQLGIGAHVHTAARSRVLALGVLANEQHVYVLGATAGQRA